MKVHQWSQLLHDTVEIYYGLIVSPHFPFWGTRTADASRSTAIYYLHRCGGANESPFAVFMKRVICQKVRLGNK
jgi:hypothetical protein